MAHFVRGSFQQAGRQAGNDDKDDDKEDDDVDDHDDDDDYIYGSYPGRPADL